MTQSLNLNLHQSSIRNVSMNHEYPMIKEEMKMAGNQNRKKATALLLAASMMTLVLAGCGGTPAASPSTTTTTAATVAGETTKAAETTAAAAADPVTLKIEVFDRANAPAGAGSANDNALTKKIQETFGTPNNITTEFVPVPRSQEVDKLNLMMASSTAPDIVFTYNKGLYQQYAIQGGLTDLSDLIAGTTDLKGYVEANSPDLLIDGKYYGVAAVRTVVDRHMSYIRTDWLEALGMSMPTTTDEWYEVMKAFKEKDPGKTGEVIPFGMRASVYDDVAHWSSLLIWSFVTATEEERMVNPYLTLPGYKEGVKFVNKLFSEGLIDPEFALDQDDRDFNANFVNGQIGFFMSDTTKPYGEMYDNLKTNVPTAKIAPVECFKNAAGEYAKPNYPGYGLFIMVPKTSSEAAAAAAVKYLDWQSSAAGAQLMSWGEEGKNYTLVDGIPAVSTEQKAVNDVERFNSGDLRIMWNGAWTKSPDDLWKQIEAGDPKYGKEVAIAQQMGLNGGFRDYQANPAFETVIESESKYGTSLDKIFVDGLIKVIMADPANFDAEYDALVSEYLSSGGQEIIDEKTAALSK